MKVPKTILINTAIPIVKNNILYVTFFINKPQINYVLIIFKIQLFDFFHSTRVDKIFDSVIIESLFQNKCRFNNI